jgi:hypothetical protein
LPLPPLPPPPSPPPPRPPPPSPPPPSPVRALSNRLQKNSTTPLTTACILSNLLICVTCFT